MNARPTIEERLQAYLDDEVTAEERRSIEAEIARSEIHRKKFDVLRAVKDALGDVADADDAADDGATPVRMPVVSPRRVPVWALVSVPLAAAVLIAIVLLTSGDGRPNGEREPDVATPAEASNAWLRVVARMDGGSHRLFDDPAIELELHPAQGLVHFGKRSRAVEPAKAAEALVRSITSPPGKGILPLYIDAEIFGPDGRTWRGPVFVPVDAKDGRLFIGDLTLRLPLSTIGARGGVRRGDPPTDAFLAPHVGLPRAADGSWAAPKPHHVDLATRFLCPEPGAYRVRLSIRTLPARAEYAWPQFDAPLVVECAFDVAGHVGPWSEPVDGLRVRLATPAATLAHPAPVAVQLENVSDRPRTYNYMGFTMAKVPQPYHLTLRTDGRDLEQGDVGIVIPAGSSFVPHAVGVIRTVVVSAAFWRSDRTPLSRLVGPHRLAVRFHFEPSFARSDDRAMWAGSVTSPELPVTIAEAPADRR